MHKVIRGIVLDKGQGKKKPLYEQLTHQLEMSIESGKVSPGERLPCVAEVASFLQVGYSTVDNAFQIMGKKGLLRVEPGRGKGPVVMSNICSKKYSLMFIKRFNNALDLKIAEGIKKYVCEMGLESVVVDIPMPKDHESFRDAVRHADSDGVILLPCEEIECVEAVKQTLERGTSMVFVDRTIEGVDVSSVSVDHTSGAYMATLHLLGIHNIPVYHLSYSSPPSSARDRIRGWAMAMQEHGFHDLKPYLWAVKHCESELTFSINDTCMDLQYNYVCEAAIELFKTRRESKYCIFALNDFVAQGIYLAAEKLGLQIGRDVFVVGFGDYPLCEYLKVPLSSVNQSHEQVGYDAAKLLHMKLIGVSKHCSIHKRIPGELCIRASSVLQKK